MSKDEIITIIAEHVRAVVPTLEAHQFSHDDKLKELGANSVDRSEILMMTMESLSLKISLVDLASARNIGELAGILREKLQSS